MNLNKIEVNEEAVKGPSEANYPHRRSDEAEKSFKPNPDLIYNPYDQSYFSVNQNQTENILLEPNNEGFFSSSSSGFSSPEFSSPNSLYYQRPEEQEVYQMNPTCQTTRLYEQYDQTYFSADQTKTEDRNQILENIGLDFEANAEDPNQILANILLDWDANSEDFSPPMQSGFWANDTFYQRWSTNSGVE